MAASSSETAFFSRTMRFSRVLRVTRKGRSDEAGADISPSFHVLMRSFRAVSLFSICVMRSTASLAGPFKKSLRQAFTMRVISGSRSVMISRKVLSAFKTSPSWLSTYATPSESFGETFFQKVSKVLAASVCDAASITASARTVTKGRRIFRCCIQ